MQLDNPERGFSFQTDGPLDMRFDPTTGESAADLVNGLPETELADLIWRYGEDRNSRRIARAVVRSRPVRTTRQLAEVIARVSPGGKHNRIHPATRTFQALRITVNNELESVESVLPVALSALEIGGRLAVIAFHSLEDRLVKQFFHRESRDCICPPEQPVCTCGHRASIRRDHPPPHRGDRGGDTAKCPGTKRTITSGRKNHCGLRIQRSRHHYCLQHHLHERKRLPTGRNLYMTPHVIQAYRQAPWRIQLQWILLFLLGLTLIAFIAGIYLSVSARAATTGRDIQGMEAESETVERQIADLESQLALLTSASQMQQRAKVGFEVIQPGTEIYLKIPGIHGPSTRSFGAPTRTRHGSCLINSSELHSVFMGMAFPGLPEFTLGEITGAAVKTPHFGRYVFSGVLLAVAGLADHYPNGAHPG